MTILLGVWAKHHNNPRPQKRENGTAGHSMDDNTALFSQFAPFRSIPQIG
jgi:hypothetical protein